MAIELVQETGRRIAAVTEEPRPVVLSHFWPVASCRVPHFPVAPMTFHKKRNKLYQWGLRHMAPVANDFWTFYTQFCAILCVLVHFGS